jgi:hypothetical protein
MTNEKLEPSSLQVVKLVNSLRLGLINLDDAVLELKELGVNERLPTLLKRYMTEKACPDAGSLESTEAHTNIISNSQAGLICLQKNDINGFHQNVKLDVLARTDACDNDCLSISETEAGLYRELLGIDVSILDVNLCLNIADSRFSCSLFRSAGIAYGITHFLFPFSNPWTLWNWKRALYRTHPQIYAGLDFIFNPS